MVPVNELRKYVVGIEYDSPDEDKGHYVMERFTDISTLKAEIADIKANGCRSPQFPPRAMPVVRYAFYVVSGRENDCLGLVID